MFYVCACTHAGFAGSIFILSSVIPISYNSRLSRRSRVKCTDFSSRRRCTLREGGHSGELLTVELVSVERASMERATMEWASMERAIMSAHSILYCPNEINSLHNLSTFPLSQVGDGTKNTLRCDSKSLMCPIELDT